MPAKNEDSISIVTRRLESKLALQRMVKGMLDGAGLEFRALKHEFAIVNPHARDKGEIRIEYETGHVSQRRVVRDDWGLLQGYEDDSESPPVAAEKIFTALGISAPQSEPGT